MRTAFSSFYDQLIPFDWEPLMNMASSYMNLILTSIFEPPRSVPFRSVLLETIQLSSFHCFGALSLFRFVVSSISIGMEPRASLNGLIIR